MKHTIVTAAARAKPGPLLVEATGKSLPQSHPNDMPFGNAPVRRKLEGRAPCRPSREGGSELEESDGGETSGKKEEGGTKSCGQDKYR